jgi:hypothetical protein
MPVHCCVFVVVFPFKRFAQQPHSRDNRRHHRVPPKDAGAELPPDSQWRESFEATGVSVSDAVEAASSLLPAHDWGNMVSCESCGQMVEHVRCRLLSKLSGGKWRCSACNVTCTQLRRTHGEWPSNAFSRLSEDCGDSGHP